MAWIESHQSLATHKKTLRLRRNLGITIPQAIGHLHLLWWWALDNAPDGDLSKIAKEDIATAAQWTGQADIFVAAMIDAGFIDQPGILHDWEDYAGKLEYHRLKNREYQKSHRERQKTLLLASTNSKSDISLTSALRKGATVPNPTVPNRTYKENILKESKILEVDDNSVKIALPPVEKPKEQKKSYGTFGNVFLTENEIKQLKERFAGAYLERVDRLSEYKASKGVKYKNDYATILNWARKDENGGSGNGTHPERVKTGYAARLEESARRNGLLD